MITSAEEGRWRKGCQRQENGTQIAIGLDYYLAEVSIAERKATYTSECIHINTTHGEVQTKPVIIVSRDILKTRRGLDKLIEYAVKIEGRGDVVWWGVDGFLSLRIS